MYQGSCLLPCLPFALTRLLRAKSFCSENTFSHFSMNAFRSASVSKHGGGVGSVLGFGRSGGFSVSPVSGCLPSSGVGVGVGVAVSSVVGQFFSQSSRSFTALAIFSFRVSLAFFPFPVFFLTSSKSLSLFFFCCFFASAPPSFGLPSPLSRSPFSFSRLSCAFFDGLFESPRILSTSPSRIAYQSSRAACRAAILSAHSLHLGARSRSGGFPVLNRSFGTSGSQSDFCALAKCANCKTIAQIKIPTHAALLDRSGVIKKRNEYQRRRQTCNRKSEIYNLPFSRGCNSMVEWQLPKLHTRVRFPSPAFISPVLK